MEYIFLNFSGNTAGLVADRELNNTLGESASHLNGVQAKSPSRVQIYEYRTLQRNHSGLIKSLIDDTAPLSAMRQKPSDSNSASPALNARPLWRIERYPVTGKVI
jgi:hypothetical protein